MKHDPVTLDGLVHDMNNVFQTLLAVASDVEEEHAQTIARSVEHAQAIMTCLKDPPSEPAPLRAIVTRATAFVDDFLKRNGAAAPSITQEIAGELRLARPWAWERVFINLFLNAARVMPNGGGIHVAGRVRVDGCEICVADQGPGIAAEVAPHLFEPYVSGYGSTGLGLQIVRDIVLEAGGQVTVRNRAEGGAEFVIRLPQQ
jgi:signal transduction histidine kinase